MSVRVVTVADIFDALTTDRAYRPALSLDTAFEILFDGVRRRWWDKDAVETLRATLDEQGRAGAA